MSKGKWSLIGLGVVVVVLATILGCASKTSAGFTRDNPTAKDSFVKPGDGTTLGIASVMRGQAAYDLVKYWSIFNAAPPPMKEILAVDVAVTFKGSKDKTVKISNSQFRLVSTLGVIYDARKDMTDQAEEQELFSGGLAFVQVNFDVPIGASGFILMYSPPGHKTVYLALE